MSLPSEILIHATHSISILLWLLSLYLLTIAHVDCCVVVTDDVIVADGANVDAIDCSAADFVGLHVAFVLIFDSAVGGAVAVKVAPTLFALDIVVVDMALLEENTRRCPLVYPYHLRHHNFVAALAM